ncbi:MAG: valine--tRNA ligase [Patescibacteria group bacterium]
MKLSKTYEPNQYESDIYALWEKVEAFTPKKSREYFSIVVPPPNANGNLHLGHGLTMAIEDIAVRYHRMQGKQALLLPGADHAGFETQVVYEKELVKEGKSRFDLSREELYSKIWDFVSANRTNFEAQFRKLGAGVDWNRFTFTLDEKIIKQAYATFKKMWDEGLIYRGERLVNYCTQHRTGFADIEVVYEDVETPLYYIKYGPFELATTRPETKFGDTAVAVHPTDTRYKDLVGKVVTIEGVNGPFDVQVIADEMVDKDFGTGVVKITPAHSFDDWEVAQRHNLPAVRVINHDGTLNYKAGRFEGLTVLEARQAVADALKEQGLLTKVDEHYRTRIGKCYKCGTVIEPMLMEQWFIKMEPLAKPAISALEKGQITFYPDSKRTQLIRYLRTLRDWNISRQIAWGIPIPAFQNINDTDDWVYDERVDQEIIEVDGSKYRRDPDVFDTWFSSSSWPYATLGYPNGQDFKNFYPLSVMETGADILYPWVSRMIMFGLYNTDKVPFESVYLHGLIQDEHGQKMSKSKGNVIDPMELVNLYGSDAFRMGIVATESPGNNRPFDRSKIVAARNFCNKLWNIARFVEDKLNDQNPSSNASPQTPADHWVLGKLQHSVREISKHLDKYRFAEAYDTLYHLVWDDVADWYIEANKHQPNTDMLGFVLRSVLQLAHPFAPFVTETIWQTSLVGSDESLLATESWPEIPKHSSTHANVFQEVINIVNEVRYLSSIVGQQQLTLYHQSNEFLNEHGRLIAKLAKIKAVESVGAGKGLNLVNTNHACWLDIGAQTAKLITKNLLEKLAEQQASIDHMQARLNNKNYIENAPKSIVDQTKQQMAEAQDLRDRTQAELARFS